MEAPGLTVSSRIVATIPVAAAARGVDPDAVCLAVGLDPATVRDVDSRIDAARYLALWGEAMVRVGDPSFPLEAAMAGGEMHNLLQFICMTSVDVREALGRASRYIRILTDAVSWSLETSPARATIAIDRAGPRGAEHGYANEFSVATIVTLGRRFTGVDWAPREVCFAHPGPADDRAHRQFFRAPVHFSRARTEIRLDQSTLDLPLVKADPSMGAFLAQYAEKLLCASPAQRSVVDDVRRCIGAGLRGETPTLRGVAIELGTSERTLRRHLSAERTSFQLLLDQARAELAKRHLESGQLSLAEIAFLLGFSAQSAFHRAFRRWTQMTPQHYMAERRARAFRSTM